MSRGMPISILLHLLVLGALATWGGLTPARPLEPQHVMRVQLASLPETRTDPQPQPVVETPPEPAVETPPVETAPPVRKEPEAILPPKEVPREEPEAKKPEIRPEPETITPQPEPAVPSEAVPADAAESTDETGETSSEPTVTATDQAFPFDYYLRTVRNNVLRGWRPKQLGFRDNSQRSCVVHFMIGRGGQVSQVTLVRSSGVSLFDREALRAVKAGRMPPLPGKFASSSLGITFTFVLKSGV